MLGPVLVHLTKKFRPFHYFASTLIQLNPKLVNIKAFGTDGEPELIKAFSVCFPNAAQLQCMKHEPKYQGHTSKLTRTLRCYERFP